MSEQLKIGFVIGNHAFDSYALNNVLKSFEDIEFYPMLMLNYIYDLGHSNCNLDGYLFYNFDQEVVDPNDPYGAHDVLPRDTFYQMGEDGKGLFFLHHSIISYVDCAYMNDVFSISDRHFKYADGVKMDIKVEKAEHPIMKGVQDFRIEDEAYLLEAPAEYEDMLLTTENPKSAKSIMWTKKLVNARMVCLALGHDARAYNDEMFKRILHQGILWCCKAI